jgi:predicted RNA-binding protein YlqC (UPF0109 family)
MKDLVAYVVKALVDKPEEVVVTEIRGRHSCVIELRVADEDLGKVIGKQGRTVRAIRAILEAASAKAGDRSILDVIERPTTKIPHGVAKYG